MAHDSFFDAMGYPKNERGEHLNPLTGKLLTTQEEMTILFDAMGYPKNERGEYIDPDTGEPFTPEELGIIFASYDPETQCAFEIIKQLEPDQFDWPEVKDKPKGPRR